jgi:acetyltransferase-like isoleucine patch superfamily enzyme
MIRKLKLKVIKLVFKIREFKYKIIFKKVSFSNNITFYGKPIISMHLNSKIIIGNNVVLCSNAKDTALGTNHPIILRTLKEDAILSIGDDTGISGATICSASSIKIGKGCLLGANVSIIDTDFHPIKSLNRRYDTKNILSLPIDIDDNVFIGYNSIVLKGVSIGKNSVIGANSIVVNNIPANCIAVGNPAKVIKGLKFEN